MPYPMMPFPTWEEFIASLRKWGVKYKEEQATLNGESFTAKYFEHKMDDETYVCAVEFDDPEERVTPSVIRYVCRQTNINPALFGLHLG